VQSGSHWGAFRARVVDGRWVETLPFEHDKHPTDMLKALSEVVYNPSRIRYPMVRLDWLRKGHQSDTSERGQNRFVRVTWSQALDFFYHELERVQKTYGPSALYAGHSGWQSVGKLHSAGAMLGRAMNLHGTYLAKAGDYSTRPSPGDPAPRGGRHGGVRAADLLAAGAGAQQDHRHLGFRSHQEPAGGLAGA